VPTVCSEDMAKKLACSVLFFVAVFLTGCDHATKAFAKASLQGVVTVVPGVFDLEYTENRDTAFSILTRHGLGEHPVLLAAVSTAIIGVLLLTWWRRRGAPRLEQVGYAAVLGGALGNVIDRLARGYVIDFMHLHHWPVFNVADMAVVMGVGLIAVSSFRERLGRGDLRDGSTS